MENVSELFASFQCYRGRVNPSEGEMSEGRWVVRSEEHYMKS